jgi:hypothetical protein
VPDKRRFRNVYVVCGQGVYMWGWEGEKRGQWGLSKGNKNGTVDSEFGANKGSYVERANIPSYIQLS